MIKVNNILRYGNKIKEDVRCAKQLKEKFFFIEG
jgi:hypothetical protein